MVTALPYYGLWIIRGHGVRGGGGILRFAMGDALCIILSGYGNIRSPIVFRIYYIMLTVFGQASVFSGSYAARRKEKYAKIWLYSYHPVLPSDRDILNLFHVRHDHNSNQTLQIVVIFFSPCTDTHTDTRTVVTWMTFFIWIEPKWYQKWATERKSHILEVPTSISSSTLKGSSN